MGSKTKVWLESPNGPKWLFKQQHRSYTGDDWSEKVAAEVAGLLGVPHATVELARRRGERGTVSRDLVGELDAVELVPGNRLLAETDSTYPEDDRYKFSDHTIDRVIAALHQPFIGLPATAPSDPAISRAADVFLGYLLLDALIGNTDRHPENWAVLFYPPRGGERVGVLCPSFDHAACLGFNISDGEREKRLSTKDRGYAVPAFVGKARSALFRASTDQKPLSPLDAFLAVAAVRPAAASFWLERLRGTDLVRLTDIVSRVPDAIMSGVTRRFVCEVLDHNRANLLKGEPT